MRFSIEDPVIQPPRPAVLNVQWCEIVLLMHQVHIFEDFRKHETLLLIELPPTTWQIHTFDRTESCLGTTVLIDRFECSPNLFTVFGIFRSPMGIVPRLYDLWAQPEAAI